MRAAGVATRWGEPVATDEEGPPEGTAEPEGEPPDPPELREPPDPPPPPPLMSPEPRIASLPWPGPP